MAQTERVIVMRFQPCGKCNGLGYLDIANKLPATRKELTCDNCQGQMMVPMEVCRGCGRAAIEWDAEVCYCGRPECWKKLVDEITIEELERSARYMNNYRGYTPGPNLSPFPVINRGRRDLGGRTQAEEDAWQRAWYEGRGMYD